MPVKRKAHPIPPSKRVHSESQKIHPILAREYDPRKAAHVPGERLMPVAVIAVLLVVFGLPALMSHLHLTGWW